MTLSKRDAFFAILLVAVLAFLFAGAGKKLGTDVPETKDHLDFYQQLEQGGNRIELEQGCVSCHPVPSLPATHPRKEECMVCHPRK
ncbi:MAG: hypothetical protein A2X84_05190 [Desulfuromonadaceae bacterium GWC2_58_13]|nr:MAG: hypothetical protein A2X84_05190 [Desulfuromonadaceae bacterium GWC2_58_13]